MGSMQARAHRFDIPRHGRPLTTATAAAAAPLRAAAASLAAAHTPHSAAIFAKRFGARDQALDSGAKSGLRAGWALVAMWVLHELRSPGGDPNIERSEAWFFGGDAPLATTFAKSDIQAAEATLARADRSPLADLLPYVLDAHASGSRRSVLRNAEETPSRTARRETGIYYTPGDVADYMASLLEGAAGQPFLDPASGTGVFLRALSRRLVLDRDVSEVLQALYAVDVDPLALDGACFVLAATLGCHDEQTPPWKLWHQARLRMVVADSIGLLAAQSALGHENIDIATRRAELAGRLASAPALPPVETLPRPPWGPSLDTWFPEVRRGFSVIANPPYAALGARPDLGELAGRIDTLAGATVTRATNTYFPFLSAMWATTKEAPSTMVVPMSIAYSTTSAAVSARRAIMRSGGKWTFRFFDRTPDALFGDDIKQRAAIAHRQPAASFEVETSAIWRWTSSGRSSLFTALPAPIPVPARTIARGIPKVGENWEAQLYAALRGVSDGPSSFRDASRTARHRLTVGATAYNRLVAYLDGGDEADRVASHRLAWSSSNEADWAYAVVVSTLTYWLWRVEGDGFHVPNTWLRTLPFTYTGTASQVAIGRLGREAWRASLLRPVTVTNRGKRTTSYAPPDVLVESIDVALITELSLGGDTTEHLTQYRQRTVEVGRGRGT